MFFIFILIQIGLIGNTDDYLSSLKKELNSYLPIAALKEKLQLTEEEIAQRGKEEICSFVSSNLWKGGFFEGNPLDPQTGSGYALMPYQGQLLSPLYVCYRECIAPYVADKDVLEIGPGRGAWAKTILSHHPHSYTCVDSLSAAHNCFWEYVGLEKKVNYIQISDFSLQEIPDDSIDYLFSFGVFCHISPLLIQHYLKNLYPKLRKGAKCFILYTDYTKYAEYYALKYRAKNPYIVAEDESLHYEQPPQAGRWYHLGIERAKQMVSELGYTVISADLNVNERDPLIYFIK